jgi:hypothetical protein
MHYVTGERVRSAFCAFAILVVLAGLLFSCGEGIRLLPFPVATVTHNANLNSANTRINYQKNVHRIEKNQENYQSKFQGGRHHPASAGFFDPSDHISFSSAAIMGGAEPLFGSKPFGTSVSYFPLKERAPPVS